MDTFEDRLAKPADWESLENLDAGTVIDEQKALADESFEQMKAEIAKEKAEKKAAKAAKKAAAAPSS